MSQREIRVDLDELGALASNLRTAHGHLAASPHYVPLHAGDERRRVEDAVSDFITKNKGPRDDMVERLKAARDAVEAAVQGFGETETCLVRALTGGNE